jgi:ABC-2 type transport system permease protein
MFSQALKRALAVASKELQVLFRDRGQLAVLFLMPIMFASVIGSTGGGGTPELSVYLVNQDTGPHSAQIVDILSEIEALDIEELDTVDEADRQVADGQALAAIIIPSGFSQAVDSFERTRVRVIVDPAQQQYGSIITGIMGAVVTPAIYQGEIRHGIRTIMADSPAFDQADPQILGAVEAQTMGVVMTQLAKMFENPFITVKGLDLEGVETRNLSSAYSYYMPSYAVMFAFFIVGTIAGTILTEREQGTFRRLLASPVHRGSLIGGKMLAYMIVVGLQVLLVLVVGRVFFNIPLGSSPVGLVLLTLALALASTSLGMLVASVTRTRSQAEGVSFVIAIVLGAVGGSIIALPDKGFLHVLSQFTPHSHAIEGYLKLMNWGAGVVDVLPQVGLLAAIGLAFFLLAIWQFRFE